jgi:hypothetical protein
MSVFLAATSNSFLFATNVLEQSDPSIGPNCCPILHRQTIASVLIVAKRKQNEKQNKEGLIGMTITRLKTIACLMTFLFVLTPARAQTNGSPADARAIAEDAYIFGYPLVTLEMTRRVTTNTAAPVGMRAPMGQFAHARKYPPITYRDVPGANADTLYSLGADELVECLLL